MRGRGGESTEHQQEHEEPDAVLTALPRSPGQVGRHPTLVAGKGISNRRGLLCVLLRYFRRKFEDS